MSESAHRSFEAHEHAGVHHAGGQPKIAALVIGVLAAILAVCEMRERGAQTHYLTHHIAASDEYAFYQARQTRAAVLNQSAQMLSALPPTPKLQDEVTAAQAAAKRLLEDTEHGNAAAQILARAKAQEESREQALHEYEMFEFVTSGLQIAIVLASVSVVTQLTRILYGGIALGAAATALAGLVVAGIV